MAEKLLNLLCVLFCVGIAWVMGLNDDTMSRVLIFAMGIFVGGTAFLNVSLALFTSSQAKLREVHAKYGRVD